MSENEKVEEVFKKLGLSTQAERNQFRGDMNMENRKRRNNYIILDNVSTQL